MRRGKAVALALALAMAWVGYLAWIMLLMDPWGMPLTNAPRDDLASLPAAPQPTTGLRGAPRRDGAPPPAGTRP